MTTTIYKANAMTGMTRREATALINADGYSLSGARTVAHKQHELVRFTRDDYAFSIAVDDQTGLVTSSYCFKHVTR